MSNIGINSIGNLILGSTEMAKAYLGTQLVFQSGGGPTPPTPGPTINYLVYGNPTINGTTLVPDTSARGYVYTDRAFDPGTDGWVIQTKMKLNTATAWKDIIASVDSAGGVSQYSIVTQFNTDYNNRSYGLYLSGNGTSWNITSNNPKGVFPLDTWRVLQIVCTRSGSNYLYKMGFPELDSWTSNLSRTSHPVFGKHISFGGGYADNSVDCEIDLSETKIWINGTLWWEAITE